MVDTKAVVMGRIRSALADGPQPAPITRDYDHSRNYPDLIDLACERIADYRASVSVIAPADLGNHLSAALTRRAAQTMVAAPGVPASWRVPEVEWRDDPLSVEELDTVDGVLTGCAVVIAETGTIVLDGGAAQGRRVLTLVPDYHLCIVRSTQIVATVPEAVARLDFTRPLTWVSGPSATSDIELDRVEGVHGPRTLEVVMLRD
jgi:L-lactate dehydrogenase complex protein LldG